MEKSEYGHRNAQARQAWADFDKAIRENNDRLLQPLLRALLNLEERLKEIYGDLKWVTRNTVNENFCERCGAFAGTIKNGIHVDPEVCVRVLRSRLQLVEREARGQFGRERPVLLMSANDEGHVESDRVSLVDITKFGISAPNLARYEETIRLTAGEAHWQYPNGEEMREDAIAWWKRYDSLVRREAERGNTWER